MARMQTDSPQPIRVFLVDDEPIVRKGLRLLFGVRPGLVVCGEADNEHDALAGILAVQPDVAVVDLTLKLGDGLSLIEQLHRRCPALRILVFSMHQEAHFATAAFAAGGHGYVVKEEGTERLLEAIQILANGGSYLSEQMAAKAPDLVPRAKTRSSTRAG
jgi:DNA-binding NarL/FixJ family response regulator